MDNSYFERFPLTLYTNDNKKSVQVIRDITRRIIIDNKSLTNLVSFEEIDVDDGSPPWIVADIYYQDPELYWVVLMVNEILDSRFEWPMNHKELVKFVEAKYVDKDGIHHYEDNEGNEVNGRIEIYSSNLDTKNVSVGDVIINRRGDGSGIIVRKIGSNGIRVLVSVGGFMHSDSIEVLDRNIIVEIDSTVPEPGIIPVTNWIYELGVNENRRRIKVLKPQFVNQFIKEFSESLS